MVHLEVDVLPKQAEFIHSSHKYTLLSGGWGTSKTWSLIFKALHYALKHPGIKIIFCAETFPMLRDTVFRDFIQICPRKFLRAMTPYTKSPLDAFFRNGSIIHFRSFDKPWKPKSFTVGAIFVEELTSLKEETFDELIGRLRQVRLPGDKKPDFPRTLGAATNPDSFNHWVYKKFIDPATKMKGAKVYYSITTDNHYLPQDYLDTLKDLKRTNPDLYKRNVLGKWGVLEGLCYELPQKLRKIPLGIEYDIFIAGLDFGWNHATALSCIGIESDTFDVVDEWFARKVDSLQIIDRVWEYHDDYDFDYIYCDPARPEIIDQMQKSGLPAEGASKGPGSVFARIMYLQGLIGNNQLRIHAQHAPNHIKEIDSYKWDKSVGGGKEKPIKVNDECMNAMEYAIWTYSNEIGLDTDIEALLAVQKRLS